MERAHGSGITVTLISVVVPGFVPQRDLLSLHSRTVNLETCPTSALRTAGQDNLSTKKVHVYCTLL